MFNNKKRKRKRIEYQVVIGLVSNSCIQKRLSWPEVMCFYQMALFFLVLLWVFFFASQRQKRNKSSVFYNDVDPLIKHQLLLMRHRLNLPPGVCLKKTNIAIVDENKIKAWPISFETDELKNTYHCYKNVKWSEFIFEQIRCQLLVKCPLCLCCIFAS